MDKATARKLNSLDDHISGMIDAYNELCCGTEGCENFKRVLRLGRLIETIKDIANEDEYVAMFDEAYKMVNR